MFVALAVACAGMPTYLGFSSQRNGAAEAAECRIGEYGLFVEKSKTLKFNGNEGQWYASTNLKKFC